MRQTLPKSIILRGYQSFTKVISSGVSFHGTMLTAFVVWNPEGKSVLIGFSVPKRQVPLAAHRIRIKRLMREAVRKHVQKIVSAAHQKECGAQIVLMFRREKTRDISRLMLGDIEPSWLDLQQRILTTI